MAETLLLCHWCGINMKQHCEHHGKIEWREIPIGTINPIIKVSFLPVPSEEDVQPDAIVG